MSAAMRLRWWGRRVRADDARSASVTEPATVLDEPAPANAVDIADDDPLLAYMARAGGPVDLQQLQLDTPAVRALRDAGVVLVVPLVTQGELLGLLNLGPRRSEQSYSSEDRRLLEELAGHAAPAVRIAQLVRQHDDQVRERSRIEQELRVATLIQQQFLPRELPRLDGWHVEAFYRPAREVGGDFYDFIELPDGRLGIVVGDVTDKGVPAALIMAKTHSILRGDAPRLPAPGDVLARANELLVSEMPANMFVTCMYAVLDPATGVLRFANAGHPVPYVRATDGTVRELRARGMPLGLLPDMRYDEAETVLAPGDQVLLHSDGVAEAHGPGRSMFGFDRLAELVGSDADPSRLIDTVLQALAVFVPDGAEQEDDITLVTVARSGRAVPEARAPIRLADFTLPSAPGNERRAIAGVTDALRGRDLDGIVLERLATAVGEATMNAIEHGNGNDPHLSVRVEVCADDDSVIVRVTDHGQGTDGVALEEPDLDAKLAGLQHARGWGLFLIRNMVDDVHVIDGNHQHTVELTVATTRRGGRNAQDR
ncbi:MAG TPA: SpoIIE family protein phosphatase [Euzebyales bacterium]